MKMWIFAAWATLAGSAALAKAPSPPTPLFASDVPIRVTLQGPMSSLASNRSETPRPATMTVDGVAYPVTLAPRGIFRKATCDFPPLRVELAKPAPPGSLFEHQHRLKLTAFCKRSEGFQQKVLLEYAAYRLYNLMTPLSFRARLATVDYLDEGGRPYISRIVYRIIPSQATTFLELKARGVDATALTALQYTRQTNYRAFDRAYTKFRHPGNGYTYVGFNLKDPRFADRRVRQAFAHAINKREIEVYFARPVLRMLIQQPLIATNRKGQYDITCTVSGGGLSGQAGAVRHGISRALIEYDAALKPVLSAAGLRMIFTVYGSPAFKVVVKHEPVAFPVPAVVPALTLEVHVYMGVVPLNV